MDATMKSVNWWARSSLNDVHVRPDERDVRIAKLEQALRLWLALMRIPAACSALNYVVGDRLEGMLNLTRQALESAD